MPQNVKFYAYHLQNAPASALFSSVRVPLGSFKAPDSLSPDKLLSLARLIFKKTNKEPIAVSSTPLTHEVFEAPNHNLSYLKAFTSMSDSDGPNSSKEGGNYAN